MLAQRISNLQINRILILPSLLLLPYLHQHTAPTGQHNSTGGIALGLPIPNTLIKPTSFSIAPANFSIARSSVGIAQDNLSIARTNFCLALISAPIAQPSVLITLTNFNIAFGTCPVASIVTETLTKIFWAKDFGQGSFHPLIKKYEFEKIVKFHYLHHFRTIFKHPFPLLNKSF